MTEWFETFFDALANDVWRALVPPAASDAEADYVAGALGLSPSPRRPARVLDVPSGEGRMALRLAARGHHVTAVDISAHAVERLRATAAAEGLPVDARVGDMRFLDRALDGAAPFDGALCWGNSFGYLDRLGTAAFLAALAAALRPGARLVIDHPLAAECVLTRPMSDEVHRAGDVALGLRQRYDAATSSYIATMTLERGGEVDERFVRHRVRTTAQVVDALDDAGFDVAALRGGVDGSPFELGSPTSIIEAVRR